MQTILSDLGLESPLVGTAVTGHIRSVGPDGFHCAVYDGSTGQVREALLLHVDAYELAEGTSPPDLTVGDAVVALVMRVSDDGPDGAQRLLLSVTAPELVVRMLSGFVDEIMAGNVIVKGVARVAGTKSKIAVAPTTAGVDARAACIGRLASRIKGAASLLNRAYGDEKLQIIEYSSDRSTYLVNAMNPVEVTDVLIERDNAIVAVEEHQLSGGIGEGGLNAQLAGQLTGLYVRVVKTGTDLRQALDQLIADRAATAQM